MGGLVAVAGPPTLYAFAPKLREPTQEPANALGRAKSSTTASPVAAITNVAAVATDSLVVFALP